MAPAAVVSAAWHPPGRGQRAALAGDCGLVPPPAPDLEGPSSRPPQPPPALYLTLHAEAGQSLLGLNFAAVSVFLPEMLRAIFSQEFFHAGDPQSIFKTLTEAKSRSAPPGDFGGRWEGPG